MRAEALAGRCFDRPGLRGQVARQELGERPFTDEADARAVALVMHRQRVLVRDPPHLVLGQVADGKQRAREQRTGTVCRK